MEDHPKGSQNYLIVGNHRKENFMLVMRYVRVDSDTSRNKRLEILKRQFLDLIAEDPKGDTDFDRDVIEAIEKLEQKYP